MDRQQFAKITLAIKAAYPHAVVIPDDASMDFWYTMLKDIEYKVAENAVMEYICTNTYPPNIAEIRKLCTERCKKLVLSFDEAWGTVQKAISTYGWYHPQQAFEIMDELTLTIVKNIGWRNICMSENPDVTRANFRMAYEEKAKKKRKQCQVPKFVEEQKLAIMEHYVKVPKLKKMED